MDHKHAIAKWEQSAPARTHFMVPFGELVAAVFDSAARYGTNPESEYVSLLAAGTLTKILRGSGDPLVSLTSPRKRSSHPVDAKSAIH